MRRESTNWEELFYDTAQQVAATAAKRTGWKVTVDDVEQYLGDFPEYNGFDLKYLIEELGRIGRAKQPVESQAARIRRLAQKAKERLRPRDEMEATIGNLNRAEEELLELLMPGIMDVPAGTETWGVIRITDRRSMSRVKKVRQLGASMATRNSDEVVRLTPGQRQKAKALFDARGIVASALVKSSNSNEAWEAMSAELLTRFPAWASAKRSAVGSERAGIVAAFITVCRAYQDKIQARQEYDRYWREAGKIARRVVNRSLSRLPRQLYIEDLVFNYLWLGQEISDADVEAQEEKIKHRAWDLARSALESAVASLPPPRLFEGIIKAAHKAIGGSGSGLPIDSEYQSFRSLIYRRTTKTQRKSLMTRKYHPPVVRIRGNVSSTPFVDELRRIGFRIEPLE
jgi:hypothetical protein